MSTYKRAIGAAIASSVVVAGLGAGLATASAEPAARPNHAQSSLLDLPLPLPIDLPVLSGLGDVGSLLSVSNPVWALISPHLEFQWLREVDGVPVPIPGATGSTYVPTLDDAGHQISALVTASLLGFLPLEMLTNAIGIPLLGSTAPTATTPPTVSGDPKVGTQLTAIAPVWDTTVERTDFQWLLSGVAIAGATTNKYTVAPGDVAKTISVRATGIKGDTPGVATSAPVLAKIGDAIASLTAPSIAGNGKLGALLSANPGTWSGAPQPTFSYQWLRNGAAIPGAGGSTYVVRVADVAKSLAVRVTAARAGFAPGTATTSGISVAKLSSTTSASLVKKTIAKSAKGLLKLTLKGTGAKPSGKVKVYDGAKLLKIYTVRSSDNGSRTVKLPKLKSGLHKIKAVYGGSSAFNGSKSKVVKLTVKK